MEFVQFIGTSRLLRFAKLMVRNRAVWTLADQGIVSIGNFLSGVIIARHLPETGYGTYALLLETILFLNSLQAALVIYPLSVSGGTHARRSLAQHASASLWMSLAMLPILGLAMTLGAILGADRADSGPMMIPLALGAVAAMALWQMQETTRRSLMAELRFADCIPGDALSYLGQVGLLALAACFGKLTLPMAFLIIGGTSAAGGFIQALQVGVERVSFQAVAEIAADFWKLGSWALLASMATLLSTVGYTWTLRLFRGLGQTGDFAALIVPLKLANPVLLGICNLLTPAVAHAARKESIAATARVVGHYARVGGAVVISYYVLLFAFPSGALEVAFGHASPYVTEAPLLRLYLLNAGVFFVLMVLMAWLNGLGESRANFICQAIQATVTLAVGLPATAIYGIPGLICGSLIATTLTVLAQLYFLRRVLGGEINYGWTPLRASAQ